MLRGALFFWWARFLGRPRWSEGPRLSERAFLVGFCTDFMTSVWVSGAFAGVLALAGLRPSGARKPQGRLSCPLAYVPETARPSTKAAEGHAIYAEPAAGNAGGPTPGTAPNDGQVQLDIIVEGLVK